jgi:hypothetical protein
MEVNTMGSTHFENLLEQAEALDFAAVPMASEMKIAARLFDRTTSIPHLQGAFARTPFPRLVRLARAAIISSETFICDLQEIVAEGGAHVTLTSRKGHNLHTDQYKYLEEQPFRTDRELFFRFFAEGEGDV